MASKGGKAGQTAMWVLMGLLIIGLGGFGIENFGGGVRKVGSVDGQDISTDDYFRALRQEMNAISRQAGRAVPFAEAASLGVDRAVRQQLVTTAALDAETARLGLSVGDVRLAQEIRDMAAFRNLSGSFDRATYAAMLQDNGWTEAEFEAQVRKDLARGLVQTAVATGFAGPDAAAAAFYDFIEERRSFSLLRLTEADLTAPVPDLDETALRAHHAANPEAFTRPETRRITYAALLADDIAATVPVDEAELRKLYDARLSDFVQPERRLVERLVFPDEAAAQAARNRLDAGQVTFEALVAERGLDMADVDLGDVARDDLGAAAETVFAMTGPAVVGPLPSSLGPALFRMNAILDAQEITFDEAREALVSEFSLDAARRQIATRIEEIDDLLAGGATLEDLAKETGMTLGTIDMEPDTAEGIAAYPRFRAEAAKATEKTFPQVFQLDDGGIAALRLDAVLPPALRPYEEVADKVAEHARAAAVRSALQARLAEVQAAVAGGAALGNFGIVEVAEAMPRGAQVNAAPRSLMNTVFDMAEDELKAVVDGDFVGLVRLDRIIPADHSAPEAEAVKAGVVAQFSQQIGQDAFALFSAALEAGARITLDEAVIGAVHAQMR
ncbi:MAG: SurA N-terminal domain-containing protein [Gemmobacter sp.]|uniref:peptidylprolyl isomerase n=1 Tax=Gemmobacter sp. TaxID=1898957 RepID=UPI00391A6F6E